ncbi:N-acetyltransferase [Niallia circulans]|uniref:GNAT family acetyltransferase n=1 Tax=Niallia circulans TaxID=1397 RepID=A0A0J1IPN8_NIACI|nr:GNAT family N-acetyltransferase [Niallia circulans]KLV27916.1 GNAT family acetyltransferase [Niallia circulans]MCM2983029.1 GNAT family N-acetyltransferase [Niallia circulans]PAD24287.1 N-acetyltransferase [Niallia circulans]PAD86886.1 N-acetyltransferase [Niallia circulans]PAE12040.1 N-acetyltransferase [Niallia circulans]
MEIRQGHIDDLPVIMEIVKKALVIMQEEGNDQWSHKYPNEASFLADMENNNLFVAIMDDKVVGSITIDRIGGKNYEKIDWSYDNKEYMVLHRLVVDPDIRGGGIASNLLAFAEVYAIEQDIFYLKTDTYSLNDKAQNLFVKNGYNKVGSTFFDGKDKPFYCYDKLFL